jgi:dTDP-4-amino-4,6-dideoxy-D-galactose acyltransferase
MSSGSLPKILGELSPEPDTSDLLESLCWDSEHFGMRMARVRHPDSPGRVRSAAELADRMDVRCLTALIDAGDTKTIAAAEEAGYRCRDVRMEIGRALSDPTPNESGVRDATDADLPRLEQLARERFGVSRYFADPNFPRERVRELYVRWLKRGFATDSRRVLVPINADGFIVCHFNSEAGIGSTELLAVSVQIERRGIGGRLLRAAEAAFTEAGLPRSSVVTQGRNLPAQRLYQAHGYKSCKVGLWMHRWAIDL